MYILGFNGPPDCGKDTLAQMVAEHMDEQGVTAPVITWPLSMPLRYLAYQMAGFTYSEDTDTYEEFKKTPFPEFLGRTGRQLMIDVSEKFLKPTYGQDILARIFFQRLIEKDFDRINGVVLVPDQGFMVEASHIHEQVGSDNYCVVRVNRPDCTFYGDSREWVYTTNDYDIQNDGTLKDLRTEAGRIYGRLVNQLGWKL